MRTFLTRAIPALLAIATPATALAGGHGGFTFTIHGFYLIDFAVFLGVLIWFGRKPIAAALDSRYKTIVQEIEEATRLREEAQARYDEYKTRLGRLEEELAEVIEEVRKGTEVECQRILEDARTTAERITAEEAARVAQEGKKMREQLAAHAVDVALELSTQQIAQRLDPAAHGQIVDRVIAELEAGATPEVQA